MRQERALRKDYLESGKIRAEDEAYKSYGVLKYSRCLNLKNAMVLPVGDTSWTVSGYD